jgi:hypothetical protein
LITNLGIDASQNQKISNKKIKWFVLSDAINSKQIESNFKESYKTVHFVFVNSLYALVNLINLTINHSIIWETSKNNF